MPAPTNTYNSVTNLSLGSIPQIEDEDTYKALLDIHNAIEILLTGSDDADALFTAFLAKFRKITAITVADSPYTVLPTDGTIRVDASGGAVSVLLPTVASAPGFRYDVKRVDTVAANAVTLDGTGAELVDAHASGVTISTLSSYTVKAHTTGYDII